MRSFGRERTGFLNAHVASRVYGAVAARIVRMRMRNVRTQKGNATYAMYGQLELNFRDSDVHV